MRIRFTVDITRTDNSSPSWQWATLGAMATKALPMLMEMFFPSKLPGLADLGMDCGEACKPRPSYRAPMHPVCDIDGHMFGGGKACGRCGAPNLTPV